MCGGAIISDFVDIKPRGRRTTTEDLWSELDTASDLFGFNSNSALDDFPNSFFHLKAPQKPKQLEKVRTEEAALAYDQAAMRIRGDKAKLNFAHHRHQPPPPSTPEPPPPAAKKRCIFPESSETSFETTESPPVLLQPLIQNEICCKNEVAQFDHGFELKDQISSLESFLGLEHEPEPSLVSGSGSESMESVDLWMLDDLVTHHQQQRQLLY
nr:ethylene-responsive transcription factor rap2-3 [Quercus suber]